MVWNIQKSAKSFAKLSSISKSWLRHKTFIIFLVRAVSPKFCRTFLLFLEEKRILACGYGFACGYKFGDVLKPTEIEFNEIQTEHCKIMQVAGGQEHSLALIGIETFD